MGGSTIENGQPLSGVLVADFSRVLAGPYASMMLADLGADVIKVESPAGDETRTWRPPTRVVTGEDGEPHEESTYYLGINRGKRSVVLDLRNADDLELAQLLAGRADVMIQNFKAGGLDRYRLDYASVRETNPSVIYASITGFGPDAGARLPGYDLLAQAASGLMSLTGDGAGPPYRSGIAVIDVLVGNHVTIGILAALRYRDATGQGQHIEANLLSSALFGMVNQGSAYAAGGVVPHRMGNAHPSVYPYEPYPTADRELIIAVANDGQFRRLCATLGTPELADDSRFLRNADRTANRVELRRLLVERLATRGADEWFSALVDAGVPAGPINTLDQGYALAEELGLRPVVPVGQGDRAVPTTRHPVRFSVTPPSYRRPPPTLDEHGDEVRAWLREEG